MVLKSIDAKEARPGNAILLDDVAYIVKANDISKPGKHGHSKCRLESEDIITGKKKVIAISGHDKIDVPMIDKRRAQVLSIIDDKSSIMDLESFETIEIPMVEELKGQLNEEDQVEYWDIEGIKIIKRKV